MQKLSRRHKENRKKTDNIIYSNLEEAIKVLKQTATAKFVETVELHANLNIDPKYADQQLRTTVTLPHGVGKTIKIAVLTNEANFAEAENNGADLVGSDELIQEISQGNINFDLLISRNTQESVIYINMFISSPRVLHHLGSLSNSISFSRRRDLHSGSSRFK